ncbi:DUF4296 domain-containing protein [Hyphobacterium sp. CCMP332]|nr:DUF4296 domain-containing protein [Hyphobacterium sp. CCMP332]
MKSALLAIGIIFFLSCNEGQTNKEGIIEKSKMTNILVDIHIAEAKVNQAKLPMDSALSYYKYLESNIYEKYEIDSAQFNSSMHYYAENIKELDKIYETVLDSLNLRSAEKDKHENN